MNRTLGLALLTCGAVYLLLFLYDTGDSHILDIAICAEVVLLYTGVALHMFADRGLRVWTGAPVGILLTSVAVAALFAYFGHTFLYGQLSPGTQQAWLDVVRTGVVVGGPIFGASIVAYRWTDYRTGAAIRPGDLVIPPPSWNGIERRGPDPGRRSGDFEGGADA